jgi:hypothetical protein
VINLEDIRRDYPLNRARPILVTEVTRMTGTTRCVAGWDVHAGRIVRPLQWNGHNWDIGDDRSVFAPGHLIACVAKIPAGSGELPHANEDLRLRDVPTLLRAFSGAELYNLIIDLAQDSIREAFECTFRDDKYVDAGTDCHSLGSIHAPRRKARFFENFDKLRLSVTDAEGTSYDLGVTDDRLLSAFDPSDPAAPYGVAEANAWLEQNASSSEIVLRVGLARAWWGKNKEWDPKRCYLQLNGVIAPNNDGLPG